MLSHEIEDTFDVYGYQRYYKNMKTAIEISGLLDHVDQYTLENFFDTFDFQGYDRLLFDEFRYYFWMYLKIYEQQA
ncbi:hypothetical protein H5P36_07100 [Bacillus sp. APMAM]|uniref:hypothetical protein n=1 Tax=Margalitia sp. FSL K6-0131 TaxID=2954604 RepID=UPI000F875033|nr:hypothetical protein [Bacillus sp. APMAM]RTZ56640.1 hypothetical protein EKO25_06740 [Bacillus sp. SAJ1]